VYAAIDEVEAMISRTLRKYKERKDVKSHSQKTSPSPDEESSIFFDVVEDEGYEPAPELAVPAVKGVVKRKVFPMPTQTLEEAILCLEYIGMFSLRFDLTRIASHCVLFH
jgi:hypothetical protein